MFSVFTSLSFPVSKCPSSMDNIKQDITDLISQPFCCQVLITSLQVTKKQIQRFFFSYHIAKSMLCCMRNNQPMLWLMQTQLPSQWLSYVPFLFAVLVPNPVSLFRLHGRLVETKAELGLASGTCSSQLSLFLTWIWISCILKHTVIGQLFSSFTWCELVNFLMVFKELSV